MTNPLSPEKRLERTLAELAGQRSIPKAGLLATTAHVAVRRACQLLVE